jgi:hypothetical protein
MKDCQIIEKHIAKVVITVIPIGKMNKNMNSDDAESMTETVIVAMLLCNSEVKVFPIGL